MSNKIAFAAVIVWLLLAILSRLDLSPLQQIWTIEGSIAIFLFIPLCIVLGGVMAGLLSTNTRFDRGSACVRFPATEGIFFVLLLIFFAQCVAFGPPAFSDSPNDARLEWGIPFIHVLTEISIRVMCLIVVGNACVRGQLNQRDRLILLASLLYTALVVSRSFMSEIIFYWGYASVVCSSGQGGHFRRLMKPLSLVVLVVGIFIGYGNWRQGSDFSIVEYGELAIESNALAWAFGYFLVNFDNLALLIAEDYRNNAFSNTFGSILQTLQIAEFKQVDDYLYVGKFNLGTAFRPFVLDYGVWVGGLVFLALWTLALTSPSWCRKLASRHALYALLIYSALCLSITSRIEQPPYLFALIWILISDRISLFK